MPLPHTHPRQPPTNENALAQRLLIFDLRNPTDAGSPLDIRVRLFVPHR